MPTLPTLCDCKKTRLALYLRSKVRLAHIYLPHHEETPNPESVACPVASQFFLRCVGGQTTHVDLMLRSMNMDGWDDMFDITAAASAKLNEPKWTSSGIWPLLFPPSQLLVIMQEILDFILHAKA